MNGSNRMGVRISAAQSLMICSADMLTSDDQHIIPRHEPSANTPAGTDEVLCPLPRYWNIRMIAATEQ